MLGLTAVAAGGYGLQRLLLPYAKEYYDRWIAGRKADKDKEESAAAAIIGDGLSTQEQGTASALADAIRVWFVTLLLFRVCQFTGSGACAWRQGGRDICSHPFQANC